MDLMFVRSFNSDIVTDPFVIVINSMEVLDCAWSETPACKV